MDLHVSVLLGILDEHVKRMKIRAIQCHVNIKGLVSMMEMNLDVFVDFNILENSVRSHHVHTIHVDTTGRVLFPRPLKRDTNVFVGLDLKDNLAKEHPAMNDHAKMAELVRL